MAGYNTLETLLYEELDQIYEEGKELDKAIWKEKIASKKGNKEGLMSIYSELSLLPKRTDFNYYEPSEIEDIENESGIKALPDDEYKEIAFECFHGAWLGRCIGCAFGQPFEGWRNPQITEWYTTANKYPIRYFFPTVSGNRRNEGLATDEKICGMPLDDDTRFTVLNYLLLKDKGYSFDSWDVGSHWAYHLPIRFVCTAETQAYLNFVNVDDFGPWGRPDNALQKLKDAKINTYLNPYREFIGAQIRADAFAYVAAGMPKLASRLAHRDAYFSHVKNGIYGEMFFAAFISAAFSEKDVSKCFDIAISVVPRQSRFYEEAVWAKTIAESNISRNCLIKELLKNAKKYNWVHTINNAVFCIAAIMRDKNDFREAVAFAVECGYDTDCNGATVGSFMGALLGEEGIPDDLKNAMQDRFSVGITPYDNYSIKKFSAEIMELREKLNK